MNVAEHARSQLDPSQEAVRAAVLPGAPGVVVATGGPGTGKTHLAQTVISDFLAGGGAADSALLLAPTRVAAAELGASLSSTVMGTQTEPLVRTASSLAFSILGHGATASGDPLPRLLTGAEQDAIIRDLLQGHAEGSAPAPAWPLDLHPALSTAGFRGQLRDLLMRAVEHGVDAAQLRELAREHDRPQWQAAAHVLQEYEQVTALASPGAFDPAYIGVAAAAVLQDDEALAGALTGGLRLLVVDDAQELTASSAALIRALHHGQLRVLLLGDGDAVVQGFRGAVGDRFVGLGNDLGSESGWAARQVQHLALGQGHRLTAGLAAVATEAVRRIGVSTGSLHRAATPRQGTGEVEVAVAHSPAQEAELVAYRLRRAHLLGGMPWSQMAVIARSGSQQDVMRRALTMAGVPVHSAPQATPLAADPAIRPLLLSIDAVVQWCAGQRDHLEAAEVVELLTSPIGRADPVALRRLRRAVRRQDPLPWISTAETPGPGDEDDDAPPAAVRRIAADVDEVMGRWVLDPRWLLAHVDSDRDLGPLTRVARVLRAGRGALEEERDSVEGEVSAHALLWALWSATGLSSLWETAALGGGAAGARADRHLDAVLRLFGAAQDYGQRRGRGDIAGFVAHVRSLEVTADSLVARASREEAVAVVTPQAGAGREWSMVAVVGVQEGVWPNLRTRGSLLGAEALVEVLNGRPIDGVTGLRSAQGQVWTDELRQFYVALTRARTRLLVTSVASVDEQPSAFIDLIDPDGQGRTSPTVPPRLTLRGAVASLRRDLIKAHIDGDVQARDRSAASLGDLAAAGVTWAQPSSWTDGREVSTRDPRVPSGPVNVSPSKVQSFNECSLRWLLTSHGGEGESMMSSAVGTLVHDIVAHDPEAGKETLIAALDERWPELRQDQSWVAAREQRQAHEMMERFVAYRAQMAAQGRELVDVELPVAVEVGRARLSGRVDRVERTADGSFVVVDLKTGKNKPAAADIATHPQLGAYQVALLEGGLSEALGPDARSGGAALAHLGGAGGKVTSVQRQPALAEAEDPHWAHELVRTSAEGMAGAQFGATLGAWCRSCAVKTCCPMQPEGDRQ
ncbi:MAG: ATP-dependent DNA helicase [Ornithinimicrobium sp.]